MSSRKYRGERICIWLASLDSKLSRGRGRKISLNKSVPRPSLTELVEAAKALGLDPVVEEKRYPRAWMKVGRVCVKKLGRRSEILAALANKIKEMRGTARG
ncbi:MAG: signal recognition particle subunit SRP19/SEC65 family protein [Fervidicoccaceae archaeon]